MIAGALNVQVTRSWTLINWKFSRLLLEESIHVCGAPQHSLTAAVQRHQLLLLLLPLSPPEEVHRKNSAEEDYVHDDNDSEPNAAHGEDEERNAIPVDGKPPRHPAEEQDAEEKEGGDIEEGVRAISLRALWFPSYDEQLPCVQENRVDLHHQAEAAIGHILSGNIPCIFFFCIILRK